MEKGKRFKAIVSKYATLWLWGEYFIHPLLFDERNYVSIATDPTYEDLLTTR
jgi:hypothetical protein